MKNVLTYIKAALVIGLLVFIIMDLREEPTSTAKIEDVAQAVLKASGLDVEEASNRSIKRFYGLDPQDYEGIVLYAPQDNMDVNEILIVKLSDVSQAQTVEDAIEDRLATQEKSFEGYGATQTKLLKDHVLKVRGNYILYAVGENAQSIQKAFLNSL
jgi:hypothetical protein